MSKKYKNYDHNDDDDIADAASYVVRSCMGNPRFTRFSYDEMLSEAYMQAAVLAKSFDPKNKQKCSYIAYLFKFLPHRMYDELCIRLLGMKRRAKESYGKKGPRFIERTYPLPEEFEDQGSVQDRCTFVVQDYDSMSSIEQDVVQMTVRGFSGRQIANAMQVSEAYISQVRKKVMPKVYLEKY